MQIDWNDSYKTGNLQIDRQHQQWFNKINYFLEATDKESRTVAALKMREYTRLHFEHEEVLMQLTQYPHAQEHTRSHVDTLKSMDALLAQIHSDQLDMEKWKVFLAHKFCHHIADADLKLAAFVTSQKRAEKRNPAPRPG